MHIYRAIVHCWVPLSATDVLIIVAAIVIIVTSWAIHIYIVHIYVVGCKRTEACLHPVLWTFDHFVTFYVQQLLYCTEERVLLFPLLLLFPLTFVVIEPMLAISQHVPCERMCVLPCYVDYPCQCTWALCLADEISAMSQQSFWWKKWGRTGRHGMLGSTKFVCFRWNLHRLQRHYTHENEFRSHSTKTISLRLRVR